jgi:outer membrane protein
MRRYMMFMVVVALALLGAEGVDAKSKEAGQASECAKLGYVDLNRALNEVNEGRAAKAKLERDGKKKRQKLEIMQKELKDMKEDLDKQRLILSQEALREKETQFQQKFLELQKTTVQFEKEFAEKEASFIKPISEKLKRVIEDLGAKEGYTMILPKEVALYSPAGTDLTDRVIASYNKAKR